MVIKTLAKDNKKSKKLESILNSKDNTDEELKWATELLVDNGSVAYANKIAK